MLADPRFVEAQGVEVLDEVQVTLQCERRVGAGAVNGAMKYPNLSLAMGVPLRSSWVNLSPNAPAGSGVGDGPEHSAMCQH